MAASLKITALWDTVPCIVEVDRRFRGAYCLHIDILQRDYMALYTRKLSSFIVLSEAASSSNESA
jgi:hypothetical protein